MSDPRADAIRRIRRGAYVKRQHTYPIHGEDLVGRHSWGVAHLLDALNPTASKVLMRAALYHDVGEFYTGDVPGPAKRLNGDAFRNALSSLQRNVDVRLGLDFHLTIVESVWLKLCDALELTIWCAETQLMMGNSHAENTFRNARTYVREAAARLIKFGDLDEQGIDLIEDLMCPEKAKWSWELPGGSHAQLEEDTANAA